MKLAKFKFEIAEKVRQSKRIFKQRTTQTYSNEQSFILTYLHLKNIFSIKKSSTFAYLLMEKPGIDLLHLVFYKQPVDKQLAWQIAEQPSGLNPLSLSIDKNYSLKITSATKQ